MPDPESDNYPANSAPRFEPEGWVPADERLFGLDRRTIAPDAGGVRAGHRDVGGVADHRRDGALPRHRQSRRCPGARRRRDIRSGGRLGHHVRSPRGPRAAVRRVSRDRDRRGRGA